MLIPGCGCKWGHFELYNILLLFLLCWCFICRKYVSKCFYLMAFPRKWLITYHSFILQPWKQITQTDVLVNATDTISVCWTFKFNISLKKVPIYTICRRVDCGAVWCDARASHTLDLFCANTRLCCCAWILLCSVFNLSANCWCS